MKEDVVSVIMRCIMRKQLAIGLSVLMLTGIGGISEFNILSDASDIAQITHLEKTSLNKPFEATSWAGFSLDLPNRTSIQTASVFFVTGKKKLNFGNIDFKDNTIAQCRKLGYTRTSCTGTRWASGFCPYNPGYFKECCLSSYKYDKSECTPPRTISSHSCGGKYICTCSSTTYPYKSCASPKVLSGESCSLNGITRYSKCSCPSNYSQTCTGLNQKGSGTGCTENGVTKYKSCTCNTGYILTCSDYGPVTPNDYCLQNGIKYYKSCKTCANECTLSSCPTGVKCTLEACSQKYCDSGTCLSGYVYWCRKPVTNCATLGYTQTSGQCSTSNYLKCPYDTSLVVCLD